MLSERQQSILEFILQNPKKSFSISELLPFFEVERTTVFRDLNSMVEKGLLLANASTRARTYQLNPQSPAYLEWDLSRPPYQRPDVSYNPVLLDDYLPNESFLLTVEQRVL